MKRVILIILLLVKIGLIHGHNIGISVAMPMDCVLDGNTESILKAKMMQILSNAGVTGNELNANIMIPEVNVLNSTEINGGMRRIVSVELGISLSIKNMITNTVFNTIVLSVKGEGYSEIEANRSAINRIDSYSQEYSQFVKSSKQKIVDYYSRNTPSIIAKANTLSVQQRYDEALALLLTYPETMPGYHDVSKTISSIFRECQTKQCRSILLSAQAAFAQRNYAKAAELVTMIDTQSDCMEEAESLLVDIKAQIDKEYRENVEMEKEKYRSEERVKMAEITAVKDIASAYYNRQTEYIFFW